MAKDEIGGVWRTVGGRRIFIKDGEDLETAMKNSGKFGKKKTAKELDDELREKEDKYLNSDKGRSELTKEKEEIDKLREELKKQAQQEGINVNEHNWRDNIGKAKETFKPKAVGAKSFEEHGVAFADKATNERFSNYLRDKYGTDDIDMITTGSEKNAKTLRDDFNKKEYDEYVKRNLENDDYLRENNSNSYFYKMTEQSNKLHTRAVEGVRSDVKAFLSGKVDYDGSREDFINDLSNEWNVSKTIVDDILYEEKKKHPRLFKPDRGK